MKEFWLRFVARFKSPKGGALVLLYAATILFSALAVIAAALSEEGELHPLSYVLFAAAAISLGYSTYTVVIYAKYIRGFARRLIDRFSFTRHLAESWGFRTVVGAIASLALGLVYSVLNAALGIIHGSIWYGALAAYYVLLVLLRAGLLMSHKRSVGIIHGAESYARAGIIMLVLNVALSSAIAQMIFDDRRFEYRDLVIYAFAAYAFYKITMAVINAHRAGRQDSMTIRAIREINLVDAAVSILALQTALLHTFGDASLDRSLFNTLTGSAVNIFSVALSIRMIVKGRGIKKRNKPTEEKEPDT